MTNETQILLVAALTIGFTHTLIGVDHYLPFAVLAKVRNWSLKKTLSITAICGVGHVLSSVLIGSIGVTFGIVLTKIELFESYRGSLAAWALISFGFLYMIWGLRKAYLNKSHKHPHIHDDDVPHSHHHHHELEHLHSHAATTSKTVYWSLFIIFILGPCEALIPLLMYPAVQHSTQLGIWVTLIFSFTTVTSMMTLVGFSYFGLKILPTHQLERYSHAFAGAILFLSGLAIELLGV